MNQILKSCRKEGTHYVFPKEKLLYKGCKYFYTQETELERFADVEMSYFGDELVAYYYASRYSGGIQVYEPLRDLHLFNVTHDANILSVLQRLAAFDQGAVFFEDVTYGGLAAMIRQKYGVGINKYEQMCAIQKYNRWGDGVQWLYEPNKELGLYRNCSSPDYTGWYVGAGQIDRICARGILLLLKDEFDGLVSEEGFYTPYMCTSQTGTEVIVWHAGKKLARSVTHPLDSEYLIENDVLPFPAKEIDFDEKFCTKNKNFRMIDFFNKHRAFKEFEFEEGLRIATLNVHNFDPIVHATKQHAFDEAVRLAQHHKLDVLCMQEHYNTKVGISQDSDYLLLRTENEHKGLAILYKKGLNLTYLGATQLFNLPGRDQDRYGLFFRLDGRLFCLTHLEIGKRLTSRSGSLLCGDDLVRTVGYNRNIRRRQLEQILKERPDIILGDLNFTKYDEEYKFLQQKNY